MATKPKPVQILEDAYNEALIEFKKDKGKSFLQNMKGNSLLWIATIGKRPEKHKAAVAVLATLLTKKIEDPNQDIRRHRKDINGFSGRTYDTQYVTPFIKEKFGTKFAMKESGWLTRSFEKPEPYTLNYTGKITPIAVKRAFLRILDNVQKQPNMAKQYLIALFIFLLMRKSEVETLILEKIPESKKKNTTIKLIIQCLKEHFSSPTPSRLPVIAVYSAYKVLMPELARYKGKRLNPLRSHVSPDKFAGLGDIEVIDEEGKYFEVVEVKHERLIDGQMIEDVYGKLENIDVERYYVLTTAEPYIKAEDVNKIEKWTEKIKKERKCEVIINGVIRSLYYYLRLMQDPIKFIDAYTNTLQEEFRKGAEVTEEHIKVWDKLLKEKLTKA